MHTIRKNIGSSLVLYLQITPDFFTYRGLKKGRTPGSINDRLKTALSAGQGKLDEIATLEVPIRVEEASKISTT